MILAQENNDVSLLLNNSLPPHLQMLETTPSFSGGKRGWCPAWPWVSRALAREWADQCHRKQGLGLETQKMLRTLSDLDKWDPWAFLCSWI